MDFVFIDGAHSFDAVRCDLAAWWPKLRQGGPIAGHDYTHGPEVKAAVDAFVTARGLDRAFRPSRNSWMIYKTLTIDAALARCPASYDLCYVGAICRASWGNFLYPFDDLLARAGSVCGTHAYIANLDCLPTIEANLGGPGSVIDNWYANELQPCGNCYVCTPYLRLNRRASATSPKNSMPTDRTRTTSGDDRRGDFRKQLDPV